MVGVEKIPDMKLRWSTNEEVLQYLSFACLNPHTLKKKHTVRPKNGAILLYDRTKVRYKSDGYDWKKRKDGKNVREDHVKLKVNGVECLYGAYVHNESVPNFHRRCYWKLKTPKIVLVHYLFIPEEVPHSLTLPQVNKAIGQLKNIFNVPESDLVSALSPAGGSEGEGGVMEGAGTSSRSSGPQHPTTRASQLLLVLNGRDNKLKRLVYQTNGHHGPAAVVTGVDKNTQTPSNSEPACPAACTGGHEPVQPPSPYAPAGMESVLVGQTNPMLNNGLPTEDMMEPMSSGAATDESFLDDMIKGDISTLKDKDYKLFELFEEASEQLGAAPVSPTPPRPLHTRTPDIVDLVNTTTLSPLSEGSVKGEDDENIPATAAVVGRKRKAPSPYYPPTTPTSPVLPSADFLHHIAAVSPDWAYLCGGEKVVLVGNWETLAGRLSVMFGNTMVPGHQIRPGVIQVVCPASSHPGMVTLNVVSEGLLITDSRTTFSYREAFAPTHWLSVDDSNFKFSLINRLEALESQVRVLSSSQYSGDLQSRMCRVSLPILSNLSRQTPLPPAPRGLRLVHLAAALGFSKLLVLLLRFRQLPECNPLVRDDMGNNALVWACVGGHAETVYILLRVFPKLRRSKDGWGRPIKQLFQGATAARTIQNHYRTYKMKKLNAAAVRIQTRFRTYKQKSSFEQMRRAVVLIQQNYRTHMKTKEVAAKTIQRCWRQTNTRHKRVLGLRENTLSFY